jgi:CheY-like chemotaxis protein
VGEGSIFTIYLPEYFEAGTVSSQPEIKDGGKKRATILLVEDEWFLLEGLRDLLGVFGSDYDLNILTAGDGKEALQILETNEPDLIISDITMPRMDGYEFLNQARKNPAWLHIPIIFLTARGEREDILKGRRSGAEEYVTKPYDAKELFAVIETQLDRHFQRQFAVQQDFDELKKSILDLLLADMNMPLGMVSNYTEKLAENVDKLKSDQDLMSYLKGIHSGSTQVSRLIEDFILLVELQTGKTVDWFALQARPTNINEVLKEIIRLQRSNDNWQNVIIEQQLSDNVPLVLIDPELLTQCLERIVDLMIALCKDFPEIGIVLTSQATDGQIILTIGTQAVSLTDEESQLVNHLLSRPEPVVLELAEYDPALLITKGVVHYHDGSIVLDVKDNRRLDFIFTFPAYQPVGEVIQFS